MSRHFFFSAMEAERIMRSKDSDSAIITEHEHYDVYFSVLFDQDMFVGVLLLVSWDI